MGNGMHACASGREREHILAKVTVGRALWAMGSVTEQGCRSGPVWATVWGRWWSVTGLVTGQGCQSELGSATVLGRLWWAMGSVTEWGCRSGPVWATVWGRW